MFIPKVEAGIDRKGADQTAYIPKIPDEPDGFRSVSGSFADLGIGSAAAERAEERTEQHHFGTDFIDSGFGKPVEKPGGAGGTTVQPPKPPKDTTRTVVRTTGEVLLTLGMVVLLFVVYQLWITNIFSAQKQASATSQLNQEWDTVLGGAQRTNHYDLTDGHGLAKLYIPSFGQDYVYTVVEGTNDNDLAIGPGHYTGSALPGQPGDMAVAGHRVSHGAPFSDLGILQSCDSIVIESDADWYVYRVLPMSNEVAGWTTGRGTQSQCDGPDGESKVAPLTGPYAQTVGREIVLPTEGDVVAQIPHHYGMKVPDNQLLPLLTLTTCNPKFSATQRMIVHAILVKDWKKDAADPTKLPPELKETT